MTHKWNRRREGYQLTPEQMPSRHAANAAAGIIFIIAIIVLIAISGLILIWLI